nr:transposase family protein [Streptomyces sp. NBC_00259]
MKTTTVSDGQGRLLWSGADRPGRMHDQTALRTEGIAEQFQLRPEVGAEVDEGYRGLANEFPDQASAPPRKPKDDAPLGDQYAWREMRRRQSSDRICAEHTHAELRQWRPSSVTPADVRTMSRLIARSPHWSRTAPPVGQPAASRAPNWFSPDRRPTDQPPAEPPGQHASTSIADWVVSRLRAHPQAPAHLQRLALLEQLSRLHSHQLTVLAPRGGQPPSAHLPHHEIPPTDQTRPRLRGRSP